MIFGLDFFNPIVEVLSGSTAPYDTGTKRIHYAQCGVVELWLVGPKRHKVEVFLLRQNPDRPARVLSGSDALMTDLLPGFELPLGRLFGCPFFFALEGRSPFSATGISLKDGTLTRRLSC